ncbi:MAG TPA: FHA domain-containing protein [Solirubrobacteraceae bacterium]|nr:FHA domain-containing protein [Solirubrobacteraceae bacterium]
MTAHTLSPTAEGITERFDPTSCLDERVRHDAIHAPAAPAREGAAAEPARSGRYIEIQGREQKLLIALSEDVMHVGRGLSADLRLDDSSVSRRHAIIVPRPSGARILDDRSANGTFVNGRRVQQADLQAGDVITLGRVVLRFVHL